MHIVCLLCISFDFLSLSNLHTHGPIRKKLGTHPRTIHSIPSCLKASPATANIPFLTPDGEVIIRVLTTSIGLVAVVASNPARKAEHPWTAGVSSTCVWLSSVSLMIS